MTSPTALKPNTGALWYPGFEKTPEPNPDTLFSTMITKGTPIVHVVRTPTHAAGPRTPETLSLWPARVRRACPGCPNVPVTSRDHRTTRDARVPDAPGTYPDEATMNDPLSPPRSVAKTSQPKPAPMSRLAVRISFLRSGSDITAATSALSPRPTIQVAMTSPHKSVRTTQTQARRLMPRLKSNAAARMNGVANGSVWMSHDTAQ